MSIVGVYREITDRALFEITGEYATGIDGTHGEDVECFLVKAGNTQISVSRRSVSGVVRVSRVDGTGSAALLAPTDEQIIALIRHMSGVRA